MVKSILIIKLGALGDLVQSFGLMRAIAAHHDGARITVMTTPPFAAMVEQSGIADTVIALPRPQFWQWGVWRDWVRAARGHDIVYDLQNNDRTEILYRLSGHKNWVGKATGYDAQNDKNIHMYEAHRRNLARAGVAVFGHDTLSWMGEAIEAPDKPYALLIPGSAPQHPGKRWPYFGDLAKALLDRNITLVLIGTDAEADLLTSIAKQDDRIVNLCGRTSLGQLVTLAQQAQCAIGNDTGPMHIIAATGCPTLSLFSGLTSPERYHPLGDNKILQSDDLGNLSVDMVLNSLPGSGG